MQARTQHPRFETLDPRLRAIYRSASPTQKLAVVSRLNAALLGLKEADLQSRFPEMPPAKRRELLRRWWLAALD
jgi:hypothetical protein